MSRKLSEDYKALHLLPATARTTSTTSSNVSVESYDDDGLVVLSVGGGGAGFTAPVKVYGSLTATPTVYDQTLATFSPVTAVGIAAASVNLAGIANINANVNPAGSTTVTVAVIAMVKPFAKLSSNNSSTVA